MALRATQVDEDNVGRALACSRLSGGLRRLPPFRRLSGLVDSLHLQRSGTFVPNHVGTPVVHSAPPGWYTRLQPRLSETETRLTLRLPVSHKVNSIAG